MKKIIRFFLNYILVGVTIINVSTCKWGCINNAYDFNDEKQQDISCNYIVPDLEKRTNKIISDRLDYIYDRDGKDISSLKKWYLKNSPNWLNKTNKKLKFIDNLEEKIQYKARKESINEFNLLANNNHNFTSFYDLQNQLNNTNLGKTNVKINWDALINSLIITNREKNEIKNKLLSFYNIFAQVYGKTNILKLLYRVAKINQHNLFGIIKYGYYCDYHRDCSLIQIMGINPISLNENNQYWQYITGQKATKSIVRTIVHEYGHALGNFIRLNLQERLKINSLVDDDPTAWWNNYFNSSYLLKNNIIKTKIDDETNYMVLSLANDTKINDPIYQKLLAYGIVRSAYGRKLHFDLFAEAFDQWIDTTENQRNIAWEKLDKFFRIDLPKIL